MQILKPFYRGRLEGHGHALPGLCLALGAPGVPEERFRHSARVVPPQALGAFHNTDGHMLLVFLNCISDLFGLHSLLSMSESLVNLERIVYMLVLKHLKHNMGKLLLQLKSICP